MSNVMNEIYHLVTERLSYQITKEKETELQLARKSALVDEILFRLGPDGMELLDALCGLDAKLDTIYGMALFREAFQLGTELSFN